MSDALELVAFDIETTGFAVEDEITVVGFGFDIGARVFLQVGDDSNVDGEALESRVRERSIRSVNLSVHDSEPELLTAVGAFGRSRLDSEELLLVAYNGERWNSGFDLPFLRTRLAKHGVAWPFSDIPYADLLPMLEQYFNTTVGGDGDGGDGGGDGNGETVRDLVGVYEMLIGGDVSSIDPFDDSVEAVDAFVDGRYGELVLHNAADVFRTLELGRLTQRYCSKSDYGVKSLTPTVEG